MKIKTKMLGALTALYVAAFASASYAEVFNGFYAGASTGWFGRKTDFGYKNTSGFKTKFTFNNLPLGIQLGYLGSSPNNFLWGVEAGFGYAFISKKQTMINARGTFAGQAIRGTVTYEQKPGFYAELATKFGWNFEQFAGYLILGVSGQQVEHKFNAKLSAGRFGSGSASQSEKDFILGLFPGVGAAMKLTDNISARLEYKYHFQKSVKAVASNIDIKMSAHDVRVGVDYAF